MAASTSTYYQLLVLAVHYVNTVLREELLIRTFQYIAATRLLEWYISHIRGNLTNILLVRLV